MSTPTTTSPAMPPARPIDDPVRGVSFLTLVAVETRKLVDTLAGRWLLVAIAAVTALVLVTMWFTASAKDSNFENYLAGTATPLMLLLPVLGILAATSEWSQRTGLTTYTLEPRRLRVLLAKLLAALVLGIASVAMAFVLTTAMTALAAGVKELAEPWKLSATIALGFVLALLLSLAQGVAVGTLIPNTPAAIVVFFLVPFAWMFLMQWEQMRTIRPWADLNAALAPLFEGAMSGEAWAHLAIASGIWVVLPLVAGAHVLRRSEV